MRRCGPSFGALPGLLSFLIFLIFLFNLSLSLSRF
jgi:hypothetical protein